MEKIKESFHDLEVQESDDYRYFTAPLTDQSPVCQPGLFEESCKLLFRNGDFQDADVILGEEDRGGILVPNVALKADIPFSLAKWYPSELEGEHSAEFSNGYADGSLYVNGIKEGDQVIIVEDLISTGSTVIGLVETVRTIGAEVVDIVAICEKPEFGGCEKVKKETGIEPKTEFKVKTEGGKTEVVEYEN